MAKLNIHLVIFLFLINFLIKINGQVLNPPYFNIAEGRKINSSSTCGEGQRDLYCRLVGSNFGYEQVAHGRLIMVISLFFRFLIKIFKKLKIKN